ncbi:hypothetical protein CYMTET_29222 [Cymbomonas tetramitiformis]|uniref:Ubiquitin-like domain-containing protein n=1 Tax=Cymbomonas tetramitiformis TaxID=36881 RepID=A0AAE0FLW3_9CHLO|nr:hypothetical protein CYMTET_29222 [Cymbomonas tetramitiformis]
MIRSKVWFFNNRKEESQEQDSCLSEEDMENEQTSQDSEGDDSSLYDTTDEEVEEEYKEVKVYLPDGKEVEVKVFPDQYASFEDMLTVLIRMYPELEELTKVDWNALRLIYNGQRVAFDKEICFLNTLFESHEPVYELDLHQEQVGG